MDALGAYGSDDDSSENSTPAAPTRNNGALSGLIKDYSDEEDEEDIPKKRKAIEVEKETEVDPEHSAPSRKRTREWDAPETSSQISFPIPRPPLSDSSLIQWNVDYTMRHRALSQERDKDTLSIELADKLNRLYQQSAGAATQGTSASTSFAQQLRSQKEFHNPHFFENVVSHFGIEDPLATTFKGTADFEKFEFNVVNAEEEARMRQAQQVQRQHEQSQQAAAVSNIAQQRQPK